MNDYPELHSGILLGDHIQILIANNDTARKCRSAPYHSIPGPAALQLGWPKSLMVPAHGHESLTPKWRGTGNFSK